MKLFFASLFLLLFIGFASCKKDTDVAPKPPAQDTSWVILKDANNYGFPLSVGHVVVEKSTNAFTTLDSTGVLRFEANFYWTDGYYLVLTASEKALYDSLKKDYNKITLKEWMDKGYVVIYGTRLWEPANNAAFLVDTDFEVRYYNELYTSAPANNIGVILTKAQHDEWKNK